MNIDFIKLGEHARKLRINNNFTRNDIYDLTGISEETLRRLENGNECKITNLEKLSFVYKFDMLNLLIQCRTIDNLFSDFISNEIINHISKLDYSGMKQTIINLITALDYNNSNTSSNYFIEFLNCFNNLEVLKTKNLEANIINTENILILLSNNRRIMLSDPYLFNFEITLSILLAIQYRRNNRNSDALKLLTRVTSTLETYFYHTEKQIKILTSLYLNIAYSYHYFGEHKKVLSLVDDVIQNKSFVFTNTTYNDFMLRKAVAYFMLKDNRYKALFISVISNETPERVSFIIESTLKNYGVNLNSILSDL